MTGGLDGEVKRLDAQVTLTSGKELLLLRALGAAEASTILDLGAGPGSFTAQLLDAFPSAVVTAVEPDADLRAIAIDRLGTTAEVVDGLATRLPFADQTFDLVVARYLFQHLDDPVAATREIARVLTPGGRIVVVDLDGELWGVSTPYDPLLSHLHQRAFASQADRGGDRFVGRRLPQILREGGFADVGLHSFTVTTEELEIDAFAPFIDPEQYLPAVEEGVLSLREYALLVADHRRFLVHPDRFILMLGFLATGVRTP